MQYRALGRTGLKVSQLCLGTTMFGGKTDEQESFRIIDHAINEGVNFIDTADVYAGNESERILGKALAAESKRDNIILATKFNFANPADMNARGLSRRHVINACDASLKRLNTEWIDLYQMHRCSSAIPIDETLRALDDLVKAGKIRYIGGSMFPAWRIVESLWVAKELGLNRLICEQPAYHLLDRTAFPTEPINSAPSTQPSIAGASERESSMGSIACDGVIESNEIKMPMGGASWAMLNPMLNWYW